MTRPSVYVTTQRTYKRWKLLHFIGWLAFGLGVLASIGAGDPTPAVFGFLVGVGFQLIARLGAWWDNG